MTIPWPRRSGRPIIFISGAWIASAIGPAVQWKSTMSHWTKLLGRLYRHDWNRPYSPSTCFAEIDDAGMTVV